MGKCQAQGTASTRVCRCDPAWESEHWEGLCWGLEDGGHYQIVNLAVRPEAQEGLEQRKGACFHRIPRAAGRESKGGGREAKKEPLKVESVLVWS